MNLFYLDTIKTSKYQDLFWEDDTFDIKLLKILTLNY